MASFLLAGQSLDSFAKPVVVDLAIVKSYIYQL
jgi:hypothetical protein